ncbi:hypothetical protein BJF83_14485 [Nocardiopsis sp. CNR-923]|uniref:hypothetical protein n=1 Tax=Nocardiopsis sp. CNR-923 TaxID=1904965 RepID=UPI000966AA20|nr:hypothetical protein [Nocardiopsis sp. CNR-923]OLT28698.1 hypothetical protein BJF83_14485 [Nocardiopsis sp. CNR-923]
MAGWRTATDAVLGRTRTGRPAPPLATLVDSAVEHEVTTVESAGRLIREGGADLVSADRPFVSAPDLAERIATGVPWSSDREPQPHDASGPHGYVDHPRHGERPFVDQRGAEG